MYQKHLKYFSLMKHQMAADFLFTFITMYRDTYKEKHLKYNETIMPQ